MLSHHVSGSWCWLSLGASTVAMIRIPTCGLSIWPQWLCFNEESFKTERILLESHTISLFLILFIRRESLWPTHFKERKHQLYLLSEGESCSVVSDSLRHHGLCSLWNSPGRNTGVGSHSLLQGIFQTQGLNLGLPQCRKTLYHLSHIYTLVYKL